MMVTGRQGGRGATHDKVRNVFIPKGLKALTPTSTDATLVPHWTPTSAPPSSQMAAGPEKDPFRHFL